MLQCKKMAVNYRETQDLTFYVGLRGISDQLLTYTCRVLSVSGVYIIIVCYYIRYRVYILYTICCMVGMR